MPKFTHLCLPANSDADIIYPDLYSIDLEVLGELKPLVETSRHLLETMRGFRHIEFDWAYGTWLFVDGGGADNIDAFQERNPLEAGWATDYNDDPDLAPLEGFSVRTNGHSVEFRCYEADTGLYSWSEPIFLRGDQIVYGSLAYDLLTGEVVEVADDEVVGE